MLNPTSKEVIKYLCKIASRANELERSRIGKRRTKGGIFLVVYYSGGGCMIQGASHIIFNEPEKT